MRRTKPRFAFYTHGFEPTTFRNYDSHKTTTATTPGGVDPYQNLRLLIFFCWFLTRRQWTANKNMTEDLMPDLSFALYSKLSAEREAERHALHDKSSTEHKTISFLKSMKTRSELSHASKHVSLSEASPDYTFLCSLRQSLRRQTPRGRSL